MAYDRTLCLVLARLVYTHPGKITTQH